MNNTIAIGMNCTGMQPASEKCSCVEKGLPIHACNVEDLNVLLALHKLTRKDVDRIDCTPEPNNSNDH